jgi:hypothetical protein
MNRSGTGQDRAEPMMDRANYADLRQLTAFRSDRPGAAQR